MYQDTRPADLDSQGDSDAWGEFRVSHPQECLALLRQLRDKTVPVMLNAPDGASMTTSLWSLDADQGKLNLSADPGHPMLARLVDANEVMAVAYLDSVKLQFDLQHLVLVRSANACALQGGLPRELYRFQRRSAFRVRLSERHAPTACFRHPSMPDMMLSLRVLDVSVGGCALWLPGDVPSLQPGTKLATVAVALDADTRFAASVTLAHVSSVSRGDGASAPGMRLGCAWKPLNSGAERTLQCWIDQAQKRRRTLVLD